MNFSPSWVNCCMSPDAFVPLASSLIECLNYCVIIITSIEFPYHEGHGGRVVTLSPPTSEAGVRFRALPQVGKLVVACHWSAVYSTKP